MNSVEIPHHILTRIYHHARESFPYECCGWLAGAKDEEQVTSVRSCVNRQDEGIHPTASQRGAETAYVMGGQDLIDLNVSFDGTNPAKVIYHSHPNGEPYFSETDKLGATSPWSEGPSYPVQQLVIGINAIQITGSVLFEWSDNVSDFVEVTRFEGAEI